MWPKCVTKLHVWNVCRNVFKYVRIAEKCPQKCPNMTKLLKCDLNSARATYVCDSWFRRHYLEFKVDHTWGICANCIWNVTWNVTICDLICDVIYECMPNYIRIESNVCYKSVPKVSQIELCSKLYEMFKMCQIAQMWLCSNSTKGQELPTCDFINAFSACHMSYATWIKFVQIVQMRQKLWKVSKIQIAQNVQNLTKLQIVQNVPKYDLNLECMPNYIRFESNMT